MAGIPKDPKEIFHEITEDYKEIFGEDLLSIILYGSATGKDYIPGKSDINFMIVLSEGAIEKLDRAFKVVKGWQKRNVAIPLFLTRSYVESSTDVFPIEYLGFQRKHILVYGEDILKPITFEPDLIRLQCEREVKGKLLLLRESFMESAGNGRKLRNIISQSIRAFLAIFEAVLFISNQEIPEDKRSVIKIACESLGIDGRLFERLFDIREGKIKQKDEELNDLFKDYLREVRKLSRVVDELGG